MNPSIMQEITLFKEFLEQEQELGIVVGSQGLDPYAASLALFASLKNAGKKVQIVSKKAPTVEVSNLVGIDKVREKFTAGDTSKLVVALPYIKGEVEKVLFTEAPNTINFHLTASEGKSITPFDLSDVKLMWGEGGAPSAIIAVGVGSLDDLNEIIGSNPAKTVNIDNYQTNTRYGDVVLVDESFSSLSEVAGKLIKELNLPTDIDSAQNILDGVLYATRNFTKPNTSPFAFEAASAAMYAGAQRKVEDAPRREVRPENQNRPQQNQQFQDRGRDQRDQRDPRNDPRQQQNRSQRVNDNDFPAMHMQGGQQNRNQNQNQGNDNRRMGGNMPRTNQQMPQRASQNFGQNRPQRQQSQQQQFGANPNDIEELMRKIKEENAKRGGGGQPFGQSNRPQRPQQNFNQPQDDVEPQEQSPIQDAQIVEEPIEPQMSQQQPQVDQPQDQNFNNPTPEEIPDDWLMPKVFKSSKNNN